jgi:tetratricopeptide (TPR) repeat protein/predicted Ser/Thr protein kinase
MVCPQCNHTNSVNALQCESCSTPLPIPAALGEETVPGGPLDGWSVPEQVGSGTPARVLEPGTVLGERYEIIALLGQGGMGAVYHARDRALERDVALKVIRPDMAANPKILSRFKQELILARQVTDRNVIRIFDIGQAEGLRFITMEFVQGESLQALLKREKKLAPERATEIMVQVSRALDAAHAEAVVHRDLKPQNIMIDKNGRVCVMDFGVARSMAGAGMTETGVLLGTPDYMSPEQAKGLPVDARSDIFSFGIISYELLCGQNPFEADTTIGKLWKRTKELARPLCELDRNLPQGLSDIIKKCLEIDPAKRFANGTELLEQLEAWQGPKAAPRPAAKSRAWIWAAVAIAAVAGVLLVTQLRPKIVSPPAKRATVSMLIADFENKTGDPIFNNTLEPMLGVALEGAPFITAYDRGAAKKVAFKLQPSAAGMDENLARSVAQREGISTVVAGAIAPEGKGYQVSVKTLDAATGNPIVREQQIHASGKQYVLTAAGKLAEGIRKGLGDALPEGAQQLAAETYTASSLDAAHAYAEAQSLQQRGKLTAAIAAYSQALKLDPQMGRAYAGIASCEQALGRPSDAEEKYKLAMERIDRMTDREKYRTRGGYYLLVRNNAKAIEEYTALVREFPADTAGHANLALAYFFDRNMAKALEEQKQELAIVPHAVLQQSNLSLYALYAGDFDTAMREAQQILKENPGFETAQRTLAIAQLAAGHVEQSRQTYAALQGMSQIGASMGTTGLADLALYEGRLTDAEGLLEKAVARDLAEKDADAAANDGATLALTQIVLKQNAQAKASAAQAVAKSKDAGVLYRVAQVYLETGDYALAQATVAPLAKRLEKEPQIYAKLIAGEALLKRGNAREAVAEFQNAQNLMDSWLGHFDLGRAYLELEDFKQASAEFALCFSRRGEATAVFLDDNPSYHLFPPVYYYQGRARQGLSDPAAAESYSTYLRIKEKAKGDPLAADARKRMN